jgi:hypothetical protein
MKPAIVCFLVLLSIGPLISYPGRVAYFDEKNIKIICKEQLQLVQTDMDMDMDTGIRQDKKILTPMEALDLVKLQYADNFEPIVSAQDENYYYKLSSADYFLAYEGQGETEQQYLFHLYEYVADDPEEGIGHVVTYGWYQVDKNTGRIQVQE